MTKYDLLSYLEQEMQKSQAIAIGMKKAYQEEFCKQIKQKLAKKGIWLFTKVQMAYPNGETQKYRLERIEFDKDGDCLLYGSRYLKRSENLAKEVQKIICFSTQIDCLTAV